MAEVERRAEEVKQVNRAIWEFAEVGLEEHAPANCWSAKLQEAGFEVKTGIAGMPTAFVASYGRANP
jgi:aminobenzoyl-glutamate utilization protein B